MAELGPGYYQQLAATDPRSIMARQLFGQASENQNTPNAISAIAKALTMGLAGYQQGQVNSEYQGREAAANETQGRAAQALETGVPDFINPGTLDPATGVVSGAGQNMGGGTPAGISAMVKVLQGNPDTAPSALASAQVAAMLGLKSRFAIQEKDADKGLRQNAATGALEERPGFGPATGGIEGTQARAKFLATPQVLPPGAQISDLSGTPGAPGTAAIGAGAAAPAGSRTLAQNTTSPMNVTLNTQKTFGQEAATKAADIVANSAEQAKAAVQTVNTTNRIRQAIDQANLGPTATLRQGIDQIAYGLGMGDQNTEQRLASTRQVVQGLADLSLTARSSLKGQGQVSDYEGKLLARARSGDIDNMTAPELKTILDVSDRLARTQYDNHATNLEAFKKTPGSEMLVPFYTPPALPSAAAPTPAAKPAAPAGNPPVPGAKQAPDGNWYVSDPARPGKYLQVK